MSRGLKEVMEQAIYGGRSFQAKGRNIVNLQGRNISVVFEEQPGGGL